MKPTAPNPSLPRDPAPAPSRSEQLSFFRQSGWMLLANMFAGALYTFVHTPVGQIAKIPGVGKTEYATFGALLDAQILFLIPAAGLQATFAQLCSSAIDPEARARLRTTMRSVLGFVILAWTVLAIGTWLGLESIQDLFRVREPWAIGCTLLTALVGLVYPVFAGLLQGSQNFFWLGNVMITSGAGRLLGVSVAVLAFGALAAGAMAGVLFGAATALSLAVWGSRSVWSGPRSPSGDVSWFRPWLALTSGLAAGSVMLGADSTFVQAAFGDEDRALYVAAGRVGRALVMLTMPVALVLFPRAARSAATGEATATLRLALGATLGTGLLAALACSLVPSLPLRVLYAGNPVFLPATELVPLFCWCMLPLTAAYTLVNNLLARGRFAAVPWLLVVAAGYGATLATMRPGILERASPKFTANDIRPALFDRLAAPKTSLDRVLSDALRVRTAAPPTPTDSRPSAEAGSLSFRVAQVLNSSILAAEVLAPDTFEGSLAPREETRALLARNPAGPNLERLRRLQIEDAYPDGVRRKAAWNVLEEFRRVIRVLGLFSLLLLAVSVLFSLPRAVVAKAVPRV